MNLASVRGPLERAARATAKRALRDVVRRWAPRREDLPLDLWRLSRDAAGELVLGGVVLSELLGLFGSPLHVVDGARLAENVARFTARPRCEVFYSYKTNPVPGVLRALHAAGVGAEVASEYELWLALRLGVEPRRIVYNGPDKSEAAIATAITHGVGLLNANTGREIDLIAAVARRLGARPAVGVRVVPPSVLRGQFGERIDNGDAFAAFERAARHPELRIVALHSHPNGEIATRARIDEFLSPLLAFSDALEERLGIALEILDVGGNLACPTVSHVSARAARLAVTFGCEPVSRPPESVLSIDEYVEHLATRVEAHFASRGRTPPRVFVEPGRAMTGNAQVLLARVAALHDRDESGLTWAVLDAGLNVAEPLRSELHQIFPLAARPGAPPRLYRLTGPSCTLADRLYDAWSLPELAPGDGVAIMDSGAYFVPFATCFSRPRPAVALVWNGRVGLLRRAETFADLTALEEEEP